MEKEQIALVLAIVALVIAAANHSSIALVIAILALVLAFSKQYEEVAVVLAVIALILTVLGTAGIIPVK